METAQSDKGIGLAVLFSLLSLAGAVGMLVAGDQFAIAGAFAVAVLAGILAVVGIQAYW